MKIDMKSILWISLNWFALILLRSCFSVRYDLKGGADIKGNTVSVQYFDNRATRVEPSLSQKMTDELRNYMESNTKLRVVNTIGDHDFSGEITDYKISPVAIAAGDQAAKTRFTITVRVKYTDSIDPDNSFDTSFSRFRDFDSTQDFSSVEGSLSEEILEEIIEQIFNKAFVNW
jgi:hypothetical protein